jgi:hypothetical protein
MISQNTDIDKDLKEMNDSDKLLNYDYFSRINKKNYDDFLIIYKKLMDDAFSSRIENPPRNLINKLGYAGLRFWQEYYYLFYLSLKIIKKYVDNSNIISIGESPMKLIFSQSLFYQDHLIRDYLYENNYPTNLIFNYLPLSGLSKFAYSNNPSYYNSSFYNAKNEEAKNNIVNKIITLLDNNLSQIIDNYKTYLERMKYDPKTIIESSQSKFIFVDRGETFNTTKTFLYLYKRIFLLQYPENNEDALKKFISKFKLITFDGNYDPEKEFESNINFVNRFCIELFGTTTIYEHYLIKLYNNDSNFIKIYTKHNKDHPIIKPVFYLQFNVPNNVINFMALPEQTYLDTRCIKSIQNYNLISATYNVKDQEQKSRNCNLSNLIIFIIFNKLKDDRTLFKLIEDLNLVKKNKLSILNENSLNLALINNSNTNIEEFKNIMIASNEYDITNINRYIVEYYKHDVNKDEYSNINFKYFDKYIKYKNKYLKLKRKF